MIENFYMFSDLNRDSNTYSFDDVFAWKPARIIAMGDDEDAYLFGMQLMLGSVEVLPFQKFHDQYWERRTKGNTLQSYLAGFIFCSDPRFLDYMMDWQGDLKWQKNVREKAHWSKPQAQLPMLKGFY